MYDPDLHCFSHEDYSLLGYKNVLIGNFLQLPWRWRPQAPPPEGQ